MSEGKRKLYTKKREFSRDAARGAAKDAHRNATEYTASYVVPRSDTLLEFLLKKCKQSRNNVKTLLSEGKVVVNGAAEKQFDFPLAKDDEVKIAKRAVKSAVDKTAINAVAKGARASRGGNAGVFTLSKLPKILYEDEDFLVFDKPEGLLSVQSDKERLSAYALAEDYLKRKGGKERAYVLHRIDKETSGVLAFAKNIRVHSMLRMKWNELVKKREYYAVVFGVPKERSGEIVSYLKEDENHLVYCASPKEGKRAVTRYETVKDNGTYALLRVEIDSGRKNQIRAAMKSLGYPVVGDEKYGYVDSLLKRLGLHASALVLSHPVSGKELFFSAPVPSIFFKLF